MLIFQCSVERLSTMAVRFWAEMRIGVETTCIENADPPAFCHLCLPRDVMIPSCGLNESAKFLACRVGFVQDVERLNTCCVLLLHLVVWNQERERDRKRNTGLLIFIYQPASLYELPGTSWDLYSVYRGLIFTNPSSVQWISERFGGPWRHRRKVYPGAKRSNMLRPRGAGYLAPWILEKS